MTPQQAYLPGPPGLRPTSGRVPHPTFGQPGRSPTAPSYDLTPTPTNRNIGYESCPFAITGDYSSLKGMSSKVIRSVLLAGFRRSNTRYRTRLRFSHFSSGTPLATRSLSFKGPESPHLNPRYSQHPLGKLPPTSHKSYYSLVFT